ncbi:MAG TPA: TIGR03545 family protein, partial [Nitrospiria bacterium]|nr:TIGR03545 family protein [Nitrospiria bacterium]
ITGDLDKLKEARTTLKQDVASLKEKTTLAARAPLEDVQRLKDKYSLSPEGLSNLSRGLFGKQIGDWARTALHWYGRVAPYLDKAGAASEEEKAARPERGTGVDIHFTEKNPMPGFWVRTARLSADFPFGNLSGALKDVSSDQPVLGKPASFDLAGEELKSIQSVTLSGVFNHVIPDAPRDDFTLNLSGLALKDKTISGSTLLPAKIKEGTVGMNGKAAFKGEAFTARFDTGLKEVSFETPLSDDAPLAQRTMASALSNITAFQVGTDITGTPEDYSIGISSDLDRVLKEAVGKEIQKEAARFEERLKKAVTEKTEAEISRLESELAGMNGISEEITSRLNLGDDLLKELAQKGLGGIKLPFGK